MNRSIDDDMSSSIGDISNIGNIGSINIKSIKESVLDLVYPPNIYCISCKRPIDRRFPYSLCPACARKVSWANENCCMQCGKSIGEDENFCPDCTAIERGFDRGITITDYGRVERELIHDFKYRNKSYLKDSLALLMIEKLQTENLKFDGIVAVPMHKERMRERGYNQAALLAGEISKITGVEYYPGALIRTKNTKPLSGLDYYARQAAVENVFQPADWVEIILKDKDILLIDDILTTGSTASACSRALKEAKVRKVTVLSFASGT